MSLWSWTSLAMPHGLSRGVEPDLSLVSTCQASYEAREVVLTGKRHKQQHAGDKIISLLAIGIISLMPHLGPYYEYKYTYAVCLYHLQLLLLAPEDGRRKLQGLVVRVACFATHTALQGKS